MNESASHDVTTLKEYVIEHQNDAKEWSQLGLPTHTQHFRLVERITQTRVCDYDVSGRYFAFRLSIAIEREDLLECELAERSGIDATQINHFTRGRRQPSLANLARILVALPNTDARWLVCG